MQQQFLFGNKTNRNGVSVTGNFGGGISLALLRPYNLEVNDLSKGTRKLIRYESNDSTLISYHFKNPMNKTVSFSQMAACLAFYRLQVRDLVKVGEI
jgi:hypothetical protein